MIKIYQDAVEGYNLEKGNQILVFETAVLTHAQTTPAGVDLLMSLFGLEPKDTPYTEEELKESFSLSKISDYMGHCNDVVKEMRDLSNRSSSNEDDSDEDDSVLYNPDIQGTGWVDEDVTVTITYSGTRRYQIEMCRALDDFLEDREFTSIGEAEDCFREWIKEDGRYESYSSEYDTTLGDEMDRETEFESIEDDGIDLWI